LRRGNGLASLVTGERSAECGRPAQRRINRKQSAAGDSQVSVQQIASLALVERTAANQR